MVDPALTLSVIRYIICRLRALGPDPVIRRARCAHVMVLQYEAWNGRSNGQTSDSRIAGRCVRPCKRYQGNARGTTEDVSSEPAKTRPQAYLLPAACMTFPRLSASGYDLFLDPGAWAPQRYCRPTTTGMGQRLGTGSRQPAKPCKPENVMDVPLRRAAVVITFRRNEHRRS